MFLRKIFKLSDQTGMGMTDALVGGAMLGLTFLGMMKLKDMQASSVNTIRGDLPTYISKIKEHLMNTTACNANFKGKVVNQNLELPYLVNAQGEKIIEVGKTSKDGVFTISSIQLRDYNATTSRADVAITLKSSGVGDNLHTKHINIFTKVKTQQGAGADVKIIDTCIDPLGLSTDELIDNLCFDADPNLTGNCNKNFNAIVDEVKKSYCQSYSNFLDYNEATKKCYPVDAKKECDGGFVRGYNQTGPICFIPPVTPPETPPKDPPPVIKKGCQVDSQAYEWGRTSPEAACFNSIPIDLKDSQTSTFVGGQKFQWGPPYTPSRQQETEGAIVLKCDDGSLSVVGTPSCLINCVVRTLNYHFPPGLPSDKQCITYTLSEGGYRFGPLEDFAIIKNNSSRRLEGSGGFTTPFCNPDGSVSWTGVPTQCAPGGGPEQ